MSVSLISMSSFWNILTTGNIFLVLVVTLIVCIYFKFYKHNKRFMELAEKLPGPKCYPVIGSAYLFGTNPEAILQNVCEISLQYPDIAAHWIGPLLYVSVQKPRNVEAILGHNNLLTKSIANDLMKCVMGEGLVTSSGEKWKKHRKLIQPSFHYQILERYVGNFISKCADFNEALASHVEKPHFDATQLINHFSYDCACETLFNEKSKSQLATDIDPYVKCVYLAGSIISCRFFKPWQYVDYMFYKTTTGRELSNYVTYLRNRSLDIIKGKREIIKFQNKIPNGFINNSGEFVNLEKMFLIKVVGT
uniref:Cytochrome P450 n=1 Tax=Clastoptera arizonana TaxID=38151 RepID=A0A1B6CZH6_9HEMI